MSQVTSNNTKNRKDNAKSSQTETQSTESKTESFANRPPPQQIPNTPFFLYPAQPSKKKSTTNTNDSKTSSDSDTRANTNVIDNAKKKGIIEIDYGKSNANVTNNNNNKNKNGVPKLTNDLNEVLHEIDSLHHRIFHLRRTNKEIKELYSDDIDCQIAYKENIQILNKNLKNLFTYFDLFRDLTQGQTHKIEKLYETDKKILEKFQDMENKSVEYMMPQSKDTNKNGNLNDTSNDNTNGNKSDNNNSKGDKTKDEDDDCGIVIDDDGGITL